MTTDWAVIPSTECTGRNTTESGRDASPTGIRTTGNCHTWLSKPLAAETRLTIRIGAAQAVQAILAEGTLVYTITGPWAHAASTNATARFTPAVRLIISAA